MPATQPAKASIKLAWKNVATKPHPFLPALNSDPIPGLAEGAIQLKQANILELPPPAPHGILVANPPYGVRVGDEDELAAFYPKLGDALKARYAGWRCYFLTADLRLAKLIGLKASKRTPLYNGPLECRLFEFRIVAGSMRPERTRG